MSLNKIQLPAIVVSGLYKNTLVTMDDGCKEKEPLVDQRYRFLGRNKKNVTLVTYSDDAVFLSELHLTFITKLLDACKINLEDVAIVNKAQEEINITALKKQLIPKKLILFGVEPTSVKLPIHFPLFKQQEFDGCIYLYVPPLEDLTIETNESKLLKSKLWVCLQNLFEL
jgi:hypothetical protein